jgi:hypothetical protein
MGNESDEDKSAYVGICAELSGIIEAMSVLHAKTSEGLKIKARSILWHVSDGELYDPSEMISNLAASLSRDVLAFAGDDAELLMLGAVFEKAWAAERGALRAMESLYSDEKGECFEGARDVTSAIVDQIEALQAHTIAGLKLKARVLMWCRGEEHEVLTGRSFNDQGTTDVRFAAAIVRDLLALDTTEA